MKNLKSRRLILFPSSMDYDTLMGMAKKAGSKATLKKTAERYLIKHGPEDREEYREWLKTLK